MAIMESTTGFTTAAGAGGAAVTVSQGTLTVRQFTTGRAWLVDFFREGQAVGFGQMLSPKLHDAINGIYGVSAAAGTYQLMSRRLMQQMFSQDVITLNQGGSGVGGTIENVGYTIYYEQPTAGQANLIDMNTLEARQQAFFMGPTLYNLRFSQANAVAGAYSATTALNAGTFGAVLKANTDYAVLGILFDETTANHLAGVRLQGPGTGNYGITIPALQGSYEDSRQYFVDQTIMFGRPLIPVINAADSGGTFFSTLGDSVASTSIVNILLAALG